MPLVSDAKARVDAAIDGALIAGTRIAIVAIRVRCTRRERNALRGTALGTGMTRGLARGALEGGAAEGARALDLHPRKVCTRRSLVRALAARVAMR